MKILFVNPCLRPKATHRYLPVGLGYVMTAVKNAGFSFDFLDIDINVYTDDDVEKYLQKHTYDVIAFGAIVTHYRWSKWFIETIKKHQPGCTVIVGNSVGSTIPEVIFDRTKADIVILGEADITIVEVLRTLATGRPLGEPHEPLQPVEHHNRGLPPTYQGKGVEGIVFRHPSTGLAVHTGRRQGIAQIDSIPLPDWDIFDVERYFQSQSGFTHPTTFYPQEEIRAMPVNTARGCVFKCTFCHHEFWHNPYRHRSPESVIQEIRRNQKKYGANYIEFWDELTFYKWNQAEKFVDKLIEADLNVHWTAAVRGDLFGRRTVDRSIRLRVAEKFVQAGAVALGYSLESANAEILQDMNKRMKASEFAEQARILQQVGIISDTSLVFGYPKESVETIEETMTMCLKAGVYPSAGFLLPQPETGMWRHAIENGYITDIEKFLIETTERQDLVLNMTQLSSEALTGEVKGWLARLNQAFGGHLECKNLIKTKGYGKHNRYQHKMIKKKRQEKEKKVPPLTNNAQMGTV
ncbi:B12-binding domain-containing radical SAM protein [Magnetococcales bacterium HHB-1]